MKVNVCFEDMTVHSTVEVADRDGAHDLAREMARDLRAGVYIKEFGTQYIIASKRRTDRLECHTGTVARKVHDAATLREDLAKGGPVYIEGFPTQEARDAFVAKVPKYIRLKGSTCSGYTETEWLAYFYLTPTTVQGSLKENRTTGAMNETGARRLEGLIRVLIAEGIVAE